MWKPITGYLNNYRINELGDVQQFQRGKWISLTVNTGGASGGGQTARIRRKTKACRRFSATGPMLLRRIRRQKRPVCNS